MVIQLFYTLAVHKHTEIIVNTSIMTVLVILDVAAICSYRRRSPFALVCSYLLEGPTLITLVVFSVLFFYQVSKHKQETVFFVAMGIGELLLMALGYLAMH